MQMRGLRNSRACLWTQPKHDAHGKQDLVLRRRDSLTDLGLRLAHRSGDHVSGEEACLVSQLEERTPAMAPVHLEADRDACAQPARA
jgi:hypothetical protein